MKETIVQFKWIIRQIKPFRLILIVIMLLEAVLSGLNIYSVLIFKNVIDSAVLENRTTVAKWLFILAAYAITELFLSFILRIVNSYSSGKLTNDIQKTLYSDLTYSQWLEYSKYHSVDFLTRITNDSRAITDLAINVLPNLVSLIVTVAGSFFLLLKLEPKMAVPAVVIFPFFVFVSRIYGRKLKKVYIESQEKESQYRAFIQESLQNILTTKTFCQESRNISILKENQASKFKLLMKTSFLSSVSNLLFSLGSWGGYFLILAWGILNLSKGIGTFGTLTALLQLIKNVQGPLFALMKSYPQLITAFGSAQRLLEIQNIPKEEILPGHYSLEHSNLTPAIEFKNVSFSYKNELPLLENISFKILPGESVALIGPSGEGKTTLIRLILSLIKPKNGKILIEGNSKKFELDENFRNFISYIPQGNTIFSGSIEDNLLFGSSEATTEELEEAAILSCSWEFISNLKDKFATIIGEKGLGLSEGQAQRLSIARALLRKKPILILDEVTSALDENTEENILRTIKNLRHKPTCIFITHRPSTLKICDRIFKVEKGKVIELEKNGAVQ